MTLFGACGFLSNTPNYYIILSFIQLLIDGHLGCFQVVFFSMMNISVNIFVSFSPFQNSSKWNSWVQEYVHFAFDKCGQIALQKAASIYTPISSQLRTVYFPASLPTMSKNINLFSICLSDRCKKKKEKRFLGVILIYISF